MTPGQRLLLKQVSPVPAWLFSAHGCGGGELEMLFQMLFSLGLYARNAAKQHFDFRIKHFPGAVLAD